MDPNDFKPKTSDEAIKTLTEKGYDVAAIHRFAKAARSWSEKGGDGWMVWKEVEAKTSTPNA